MPDRAVSIEGVRVPRFLYGTAWKEDETQRLTQLALEQGFRGIDTANQRRHYHEAAVGQAIAASIESGLVALDDLFLQTKFTFRRGQDDRLPYDAEALIPIQVEQSFASSLKHLGTERIDSYVLHGPTQGIGLTLDDWEAWRAMEAIHDSGRARLLGVSNVTIDQLQQLCRRACIRPRFVQNRCYAAQGWDSLVRRFCAANGLVYQGFSLLTANRAAMSRPELAQIAGDNTLSAPVDNHGGVAPDAVPQGSPEPLDGGGIYDVNGQARTVTLDQGVYPVGYALEFERQVGWQRVARLGPVNALAQAHPLERHFAMLAVAEDRGRVGDDRDAKRLHAAPRLAIVSPASRSGLDHTRVRKHPPEVRGRGPGSHRRA